jgi:ubiquinone/menaquinone biosynthesis C-methylase UbiE
MKLGKIEKWFMTRHKHDEYVISITEKLLSFVSVKEKQNYLEIGCGDGAVSRHIAKKYRLNVTGTDVDPEMIRFAKKNIDNIQNIQFLVTGATDLPFQDNNFDIVLSFGVLHHIPNWLDVLKEIKRVLKPKGYLVYFDLIFPKGLAKIGKLFKRYFGIVTLDDLNLFIKKNNFSTIYSSPLQKSIFGNSYEAVYQKN